MLGGGGGVNQHMENSICFLQILFESFPYWNDKDLLKKLSTMPRPKNLEKCVFFHLTIFLKIMTILLYREFCISYEHAFD